MKYYDDKSQNLGTLADSVDLLFNVKFVERQQRMKCGGKLVDLFKWKQSHYKAKFVPFSDYDYTQSLLT